MTRFALNLKGRWLTIELDVGGHGKARFDSACFTWETADDNGHVLLINVLTRGAPDVRFSLREPDCMHRPI